MSFKLKYWNGRGLMEVPRIMMSLSGKFPPTDYADLRIGVKEDVEAKGGDSSKVVPMNEIGNLDFNLGRVPICETPQGSIGQSAAINYFIAAECGLLGSNNFEAAQILAIQEHLKELSTSWGGLVPWGTVPEEETLNKWFDEGATDVSGPAVRDNMKSRYLTWYMGRLEGIVGANGFCVGDKFSLADVLLFNMFANTLDEKDILGELHPTRCVPFASLERTNAALAKHPKLKKIIDNVASNDNVKKWVASRGKQGF